MTTLFKRVGDTMGHHELRVLGTHGDTRTIWNPREPEEVAAARATFDRLKRNKFSIFKVGQDGEKGELMDAFDPNAAKLIAVPPIAGGAEPPGAGRMLSELMRTGARLLPQLVGDFFEDGEDGGVVKACAVGQATIAWAAGCGNEGWRYHDWLPYTHSLMRSVYFGMAMCPVCASGCEHRMLGIVQHLNDTHEWPTERIADWLEDAGLDVRVPQEPHSV